MTMIWISLHPQARPEMLGYLPEWLSEEDPRSAREQLDTGYRNGGGWRPFNGFVILPDGTLKYPGDTPVRPLFETQLRNETIRVYMHDWVAIIQADGSCEVARMD